MTLKTNEIDETTDQMSFEADQVIIGGRAGHAAAIPVAESSIQKRSKS